MRNFKPSDPSIWLPFLHAAIALALVLNLHLPHWQKERSRDVAFQAYVEREARAGRWPPVYGVGWEVDHFGPPKQITAMFPADLPSMVIAGFLVIPSNARDRLLERAPGRILPTTRVVVFAVLFAAVVALQWYLIALFAKPPRTSLAWQKFLYAGPMAGIALGQVLPDKWANWFTLGALPFWGFIFVGTLSQYWKRRRSAEELANSTDSDKSGGGR
jgi:hypothetical protein